MDEVSYRNLTQRINISDIRADMLIFPHHGGHTNSPDETQFARELCQRVQPNKVIFSIGRGRYGTPRQEIIEGVRAARPSAHILCTQLSANCSSSLVSLTSSHLTSVPSEGGIGNECCAGSIIVNIDGAQTTYEPDNDHRTFINNHLTGGVVC